jgi:hypothetical protein
MAEGKITFKSTDPNMSFTCWLNNDGVKVTGGYGGWDVVQRPRRLSLTQWNGRDPISMDIAILIDGFASNDSVENECLILEKMAGVGGKDFNDPPVVNLEGAAVPHRNQDYRITNIQWGEMIRRVSDGDRTRQEAVVSVIRDVRADKIAFLSAAQAARAKAERKAAAKAAKKHH